MSRIGKMPIFIPKGVEVKVTPDNVVLVKGPKGELKQEVKPTIRVKVENNQIICERLNDEKQTKAYHGLYRTLINNMVKGVHEGFTITMEMVGVGYKASVSGNLLDLSLGFSHNVIFEMPKEVQVEVITEKGQNPKIILRSYDRQVLGQVAAKIRALRKPEPYKGKGIRYINEYIRRKAGKAAAAK
ncbi:MAG: 50S ribosomal protein L6 [Bacteroidales bacterium]|nr:50S ribosomal protein L6 [Bacteroidales bacterium]